MSSDFDSLLTVTTKQMREHDLSDFSSDQVKVLIRYLRRLKGWVAWPEKQNVIDTIEYAHEVYAQISRSNVAAEREKGKVRLAARRKRLAPKRVG